MQTLAAASSRLKSGLISVFITNLGKYNKGELVGEWLELPTTHDLMKQCLTRIEIDGIRYEEYFLTDYESAIDGISTYISTYSNLDELNYLATKVSELSCHELSIYQSAITLGYNISSITDLINLTDNLDAYQLLADINNEYDLGYYWIEESGAYDSNQLGYLSQYIDYERYGRDICLEQNGAFCDDGYIYHTGDYFEHNYDGKTVPEIYCL